MLDACLAILILVFKAHHNHFFYKICVNLCNLWAEISIPDVCRIGVVIFLPL